LNGAKKFNPIINLMKIRKKMDKLLVGNYRVKELHRGIIFMCNDFCEANNVFQSMNQEGRYFLQESVESNQEGTHIFQWKILSTRIIDITGKCVYHGI
jgi:hypothetical protein